MKVLNQYVYKHRNGSWQILYECQEGIYFTTDTGAFGQRDMTIVPMNALEAEPIIAEINKTETPGTVTGR